MMSGGDTSAQRLEATAQRKERLDRNFDKKIAAAEHEVAEADIQRQEHEAKLAEDFPRNQEVQRAEFAEQQAALDAKRREFSHSRRELDLATKRLGDAEDIWRQFKEGFIFESWKYIFGGKADYLSSRYHDFVEILMAAWGAMSHLQATEAGVQYSGHQVSAPQPTSIAGNGPPSPERLTIARQTVVGEENAVEGAKATLERQKSQVAAAEAEVQRRADLIGKQAENQRRGMARQLAEATRKAQNAHKGVDVIRKEKKEAERELRQEEKRIEREPDQPSVPPRVG